MTTPTDLKTINTFGVGQLPQIQFGRHSVQQLPSLIQGYGTTALIVTGKRSFVKSDHWTQLLTALTAEGVSWFHLTVDGEPSPGLVDAAVAQHKDASIDAVVAIGGGSVLDAAKAIAGLLRPGNSVMDHLEGVGKGLPYTGPAVPLIAVPTTAGTGSEATKNAVLSEMGENGFKKSFRDDQLVANIALIDPDLLASCPKSQIAANGMDAFTQLMESYVATKASAFTDALAWSGMEAFSRGFWAAWEADHPQADAGYSQIAYASLMSGITLAQAGLGSVHGLASPLGAFFPIPHGVVCGTLLAEATAVNIAALRDREPTSPALAKYANVGRLIVADQALADAEACDALVNTLRAWVARLDIPRLGSFGMTADDYPRVCANARGGSMKTNPLVITDAELIQILDARL